MVNDHFRVEKERKLLLFNGQRRDEFISSLRATTSNAILVMMGQEEFTTKATIRALKVVDEAPVSFRLMVAAEDSAPSVYRADSRLTDAHWKAVRLNVCTANPADPRIRVVLSGFREPSGSHTRIVIHERDDVSHRGLRSGPHRPC
ncbi:hypothetical protein Q9R20_12100 [Microbacterium sp. PRF11]|nr:hypothetical protein [Microbacterium sp. PRF11]MDT0117732.1 hypothetical protein [Microbacterium sp. PRF11]